MITIRKICIFVALLSFILMPVRQAEALIPFEITLPETAGKISEWIQKTISYVHDQINAITESKIGVGIGKGIKGLKKGKEWIQDKVKDIKKAIAAVKAGSSMAYEVLVLTRNVVNDGDRIVQATKGLEEAIETLKEEAKINKELLDIKIENAKENLAIMKLDHQRLKDEGARLDETYSMFLEEEALEHAIEDMKIEKVMIDRNLVQDIVQLRLAVTQEIKRLENNYKQSMEKLKALKNFINSNTNQGEYEENLNVPPAEIVSKAKEEFAIFDGEHDSIAKSEQRTKNIKKEAITLNMSSINKANQFIATFDNPDNDTSLNLGLAGTGEGKTEAVQPTIENIVIQIDLIKNIIELELKDLEMKLLEIMQYNINHKIQKVETDDNLLVNLCKYKVKTTKSSNDNTPNNESDIDSDNDNHSINDIIF